MKHMNEASNSNKTWINLFTHKKKKTKKEEKRSKVNILSFARLLLQSELFKPSVSKHFNSSYIIIMKPNIQPVWKKLHTFKKPLYK